MAARYIEKVAKFFSLVRFSHTLFALPFALIGFFLAISQGAGEFSFRLFVLILLAMVFARNSAMGFNRLVDKKVDAKNPRTATRELPASKLTSRSVVLFVLINAALFVIVAGMINNTTLFLSVPALVVLLGYSYLKRFTALSHYGVGLALGIAPSAAYISVTGNLSTPAMLLSVIVFLWSGSFDILYSLSDEEFDRKEGLHSIPVLLGRRASLVISAAGHLLVLPLLLQLYKVTPCFGPIYITGASIFSLLLVYQHTIVKAGDISRLNEAFFTSNGVASVIFAIFTVADIYI